MQNNKKGSLKPSANILRIQQVALEKLNQANRKDVIKELFESQQLVMYPTEEDELSNYMLVDNAVQQVIKEVDNEEINQIDSPIKNLTLKEEKKSNDFVNLAADDQFVQKEGNYPGQRPSIDSFEDLALDEVYNPQVVVYMTEENRIVDENYIRKNNAIDNSKLFIQEDHVRQKEPTVNWFKLYADKKFDFRNDTQLYNQIRESLGTKFDLTPKLQAYDQIYKERESSNTQIRESLLQSNILDPNMVNVTKLRLQNLQRQSAWCLMLGIDHNSDEFANFQSLYNDCLKNNTDDHENELLRQIRLDVNRTFRPFNLKCLNSDPFKGKNKLYNILKVYALLFDPEVGYTQGMNFIAAMILMHIPNEALACNIFVKLLQKDNWARMYICSTPKLFDISQIIMDRVQHEIPDLFAHFFEYQILLEIILAGPMMTLFGNTLGFNDATHCLNMFILDGEKFMIDLVVNIFKNMAPQIISLKDSFEIQAYLCKDVFEQAIKEDKFYKR